MLNITVSDIEKAPLVLDKWAGKAIGLIDPEYKDAMPKRKQYLPAFFQKMNRASQQAV